MPTTEEYLVRWENVKQVLDKRQKITEPQLEESQNVLRKNTRYTIES